MLKHMSNSPFSFAMSRHIWEAKYRYHEGDVVRDSSIEDTWRRIATALAGLEAGTGADRQAQFYSVLEGFKFLPGGRIQAGAGTSHKVTLFNCFVMGVIEDSMDGIFDALKEGALTMQQGGGVGYDFSTLRPRGARAYSVGSVASGPVSFMRIWDSMCATILSTGSRRGAMMGTLRCDHPDIEEFFTAKQDPTQLRHFNLSVLVSDAFMQAVRDDESWPLLFPTAEHETGEEILPRVWSGGRTEVPCVVHRRVQARALWDRIMKATYDYAEPGVLFIDRINQCNNLYYREHISATNPCGEVPLPPYGACNLGSLNLVQFVRDPYTSKARLDMDALRAATPIAVRLLDNVIDASRFPLPQQAEQARATRRIGLGVTGLADALMMLGLHYGSAASLQLAAAAMQAICHTAYQASIALASEKGPFPAFDGEAYLQGAFVRALPEVLRDGIARHGIRNSHLTAIAPTGTISLLANNISSGLEPVFNADYTRRVLQHDGDYTEYRITDYAVARWRARGESNGALPPAYVDAQALAPETHLAMQAALQPYVDQAISKTINVPQDCNFDDFRALYTRAYEQGLKGCTTFRPNPITGAVLYPDEADQGARCCGVDREAD